MAAISPRTPGIVAHAPAIAAIDPSPIVRRSGGGRVVVGGGASKKK